MLMPGVELFVQSEADPETVDVEVRLRLLMLGVRPVRLVTPTVVDVKWPNPEVIPLRPVTPPTPVFSPGKENSKHNIICLFVLQMPQLLVYCSVDELRQWSFASSLRGKNKVKNVFTQLSSGKKVTSS